MTLICYWHSPPLSWIYYGLLHLVLHEALERIETKVSPHCLFGNERALHTAPHDMTYCTNIHNE